VRTALLALLIVAALATPARADIQLIDPATGAATTLVADDFVRLLGPTGDGFVIEIARNGRRLRLATDGSTWPAPELDRATEIGPAGQTLWRTPDGLELHAPDGRVVGMFSLPLIWSDADVAWSADGARVAIVGDDRLRVVDTVTGAVITERRAEDSRLTPQAFSPDAAALVFADERDALRYDLATGAVTTLGRADHVAWSPTGQLALVRERSIAVLGSAGVKARSDFFFPPQWSPDGRTLAYAAQFSQGACSDPLLGVAVAAPGGSPRTLVEPSGRGLRGFAWASDGRLAVDREPDFSSDARGKRHPWPKRVASEYYVIGRGGNAAVRRVLLRVARSLKAGAEREPVLARMRRDMAPIQDRYDVDDTIVRDAIAIELDRWLGAAGFEPVEAADEFMC
jgi:hypothetical protein